MTISFNFFTFFSDNLSFGGIMRGKDYHDNNVFGDKYSEEYFEELKHYYHDNLFLS